MLQLSANGQSLMSHIDDDGIMTMMWAKMSAVISSDSKKATNYVALGAEKRDRAAAPLPQERFSQVCLDFLHSDYFDCLKQRAIILTPIYSNRVRFIWDLFMHPHFSDREERR